MPVSRLLTEGLAEQVAAAYADAEVRLLRLIAQRLEAGAESPTWAEDKLAELQVLRGRARRIMAGATSEALDALMVALRTAYLRGTAAGQGDVDALGIDLDAAPEQAERQVAALYASMQEQWQGHELQVVRAVGDVYRDAVVRAAGGTLTGAATRLQDAQVALDRLASKGVTGFIDTAGRQWGLQTYVEMATRSVTTQAAVAGHMDRLQQAGINLFLVSNSSRECELCRPWEGKVLSRGPVAALTRNALTGAMEAVKADGTVREATSAGLFHPNCTHNLSGYIHGATKRNDATSSRTPPVTMSKAKGTRDDPVIATVRPDVIREATKATQHLPSMREARELGLTEDDTWDAFLAYVDHPGNQAKPRERIEYWREQIRSGADVPPVKVTQPFGPGKANVVDGHHRLAAYLLEGKPAPIRLENGGRPDFLDRFMEAPAGAGYAERQAQRAMERKVREWKRREAAALTPEAKRKAAAKTREWRAKIAAHVEATGLPRKRNRESVTAAR